MTISTKHRQNSKRKQMGNPSKHWQKKKKKEKECVYHALREWLGTHTPKGGPFASQYFPSFTIRCIIVTVNSQIKQ